MISLSKNFPYPYKIKKPKTQFLQPDRVANHSFHNLCPIHHSNTVGNHKRDCITTDFLNQPNGLQDLHILSSLLRGAQVMISSTLRIISAASVAESKTACLTLNASKIPRCAISPTCQNINCHQESTKEATLFIYLVILMGRLHIISLEPTTSLAHPPPRNHKKEEANSWKCRQQLQFKQIETKKQRPKL